MILKYHSTDNGFCRVYFKIAINHSYFYYCVQEDYPKILNIFACTSDGFYCEPSHPVKLKPDVKFEKFKVTCELENQVYRFLQERNLFYE